MLIDAIVIFPLVTKRKTKDTRKKSIKSLTQAKIYSRLFISEFFCILLVFHTNYPIYRSYKFLYIVKVFENIQLVF